MEKSHGNAGYQPAQPLSDKDELQLQRIVIPPPHIDYTSGKANFSIQQALPFEHGSTSCGNPIFLRSIVTCHQLSYNHAMLSWTYDGRRQAQQILPFLLLGPATVAKDPEVIHKEGVTFMLAVRDARMAKKMPRLNDPARFSSAEGLETATFDLSNAYDLVTNLRPVVKVLNDHLERSATQCPISAVSDIRGKVLVFCESGNERSAVVVIAYIMIVYGLNAITAIQAVQSQRFCINTDEDMKNMLLNFEEILKAEREVAMSKAHDLQLLGALNTSNRHVPKLNSSTKRNIDRAYEDDTEMEDVEEWEAAGTTRVGVAPYKDNDV